VREAKGELDLVYPPISMRAEPHVAVVDDNVDRKKTRHAAEAYLRYMYSDEAQEIAAKHYYRPSNATILNKYAERFPEIRLFPVTDIARDIAAAHKELIAEGGVFDDIYKPKH
jgi:sulfate transport system substrate-binding protein